MRRNTERSGDDAVATGGVRGTGEATVGAAASLSVSVLASGWVLIVKM